MQNPYIIIAAEEIQKGDLIVNVGKVIDLQDYTRVIRIKFSEGTKVSLHVNPWESFGRNQKLTIIR